MSSHEKLRRHILQRQKFNPSGHLVYYVSQLSMEFQLPNSEIQEVLAEMAEARLIYMAKWHDGEWREIPFEEWPDTATFFRSTDDKGSLRIRVLARGSEMIAEVAKGTIGFA